MVLTPKTIRSGEDESIVQDHSFSSNTRKRKSRDIRVVLSQRILRPPPPAEIHVIPNHSNDMLSETSNISSLNEKWYVFIFAKFGDESGFEETVPICDSMGLTVDSPMKDIMEQGEIASIFGINEITNCRFHIEASIERGYLNFQHLTISELNRLISFSNTISEEDKNKTWFYVLIEF